MAAGDGQDCCHGRMPSRRQSLSWSRAGMAPETGTALSDTTGGEPAEGVRASDAERDATVERLSQATGEGG